MARQDTNEAFLQSSFLYGGNAAWIEDLHARYLEDPTSVDVSWRNFFSSLKELPHDVAAQARGASWAREGWPIRANGELLSALGGEFSLLQGHIGEAVRSAAQRRGVDLADGDV